VAAELGLGALLAAARTKLLATLPPELHGRAERVRQRFLLDAPGWFSRPDDAPLLPVVATALWRDRRLDLRAARPGGEVQRRVDPLGLVCKAGAWYLVAAHRGRARTYRVGRLTSAVVLDQPLRRPEDFDLAAWWSESSAAFDRSLLRSHVVVRCSGAGRRGLVEALGETAAALAEPVGSGGCGPAGVDLVTLRVPVESSEVAAHQLLAVADQVELLDPPEARAALAERAARIAARHRRG
jgi:predicted DNA-binding transcriptional regulator YafY